MQRMAADVRITQGSARTIHKRSRRSSSRPKRSAEAFGVETLAPPTALSLPSLQGIPATLNHEINGELLYQLAAAMTHLGLVSPGLHDPTKAVVEFVQSAVVSAIGQRRIRLLKETVGYCVELADKPRTRTVNNTIEGVEGLLFKVACSEFGYLEMGAVVEAMEADTPGLGAAFYRTLIHTIHSVMRVYDYTDALYCEENTREMARTRERTKSQISNQSCLNAFEKAQSGVRSASSLPGDELSRRTGMVVSQNGSRCCGGSLSFHGSPNAIVRTSSRMTTTMILQSHLS
jgi:hypothetical protein